MRVLNLGSTFENFTYEKTWLFKTLYNNFAVAYAVVISVNKVVRQMENTQKNKWLIKRGTQWLRYW